MPYFNHLRSMPNGKTYSFSTCLYDIYLEVYSDWVWRSQGLFEVCIDICKNHHRSQTSTKGFGFETAPEVNTLGGRSGKTLHICLILMFGLAENIHCEHFHIMLRAQYRRLYISFKFGQSWMYPREQKKVLCTFDGVLVCCLSVARQPAHLSWRTNRHYRKVLIVRKVFWFLLVVMVNPSKKCYLSDCLAFCCARVKLHVFCESRLCAPWHLLKETAHYSN